MADQPADPEKTGDRGDPSGRSLLGSPDSDAPIDLPLGATLEPVLRRLCGGRLSPVRWFRTDWQRGGASTGYSVFDDGQGEEGGEQQVVVKMPVGPGERQWLIALQEADGLAPRLYAHGDTLGGYDIAWVVMERLEHGPLSAVWGGAEFDLLIDAAARFYAAADGCDAREPAKEDWKQTLAQARRRAHVPSFPDSQRWNKALKRSQRKLGEWIKIWDDRPTDHVCHGDLHPGNAMTRSRPPGGPAVLFDFALTRLGHWVEDAVYLEHLYWGQERRLEGRNLCKLIAHARKANGLVVSSHWPELAAIRQVCLAIGAPLRFGREADVVHLRAALEVLERHVL